MLKRNLPVEVEARAAGDWTRILELKTVYTAKTITGFHNVTSYFNPESGLLPFYFFVNSISLSINIPE